MKGNDIRESYLSFFENKKDHLRLKSFSLIPKDDPSLLLIGAGMAPLKPFFTGKVEPPRHRITTSQKCIRTGDIENVGYTARHHTFFEMLGNFSFGDYFKKEAISWAWEFLTEVIKLDSSRLYVTIYPDDKEAYDYWHTMIGLPENHIYPLADNFWEIGEGPCGPDSEIFFDQGEEFGTDPENQMGGDGDRFLEIWNLVFSQYDRQKDGSYLPLAKKNIDTGAGLERLAAVLQHKKNNFETDLFFPIIEEASTLSGVSYGKSAQGDVALKVISDHARAITNMIADGILPSNEGRGYVLRRILRRAVRFGKLLGIQDPFMGHMIDVVIDMMKPAYPELLDKQAYIKKVAGMEEERFQTTLNAGIDLLSEMIEDTQKHNEKNISGERVFKLYDTYGFPWELTQEIAAEKGLSVDKAGFEAAMAEQKERARAARAKVSAKVATPDTTKLDISSLSTIDEDGTTKLLLVGKDGKELASAADGTEITAILLNTPFHAEGGGQIGDTGIITGAEGSIIVENTKKLPDGITYIIGEVKEGIIRAGEEVNVVVDRDRREKLARNHTGTHMLQAALRRVLGDQVNQAGSLVLPDRLRFDFTWPEALSAKQIREVEDIVNAEIITNTSVSINEMPIDEAKNLGAMALFGEKYGDIVRVVSVGEFSKELCGGTHVSNTGELGSFRIIGESGIGSGVRRIEAVTGWAAYEMMQEDRKLINSAADALKSNSTGILERIEKLQAELKDAEHELSALKKNKVQDELKELIQNAEVKNGVSILGAVVHVDNMDELREAADFVKAKLPVSAVILGTAAGDKVNLVGMASPDAVKAGIHMGNVISQAAKICGGGGGGKPANAQAGGKDVSKLADAVAQGVKIISGMLD